MQLIRSLEFSSKVCQKCHNHLALIATFRFDLIEKQSKFYNHITELEESKNLDIFESHFTEPIVKIENQKPKILFCDLCEFSSIAKRDIEQHMRSHRRKPNKRERPSSFCCESCGLSFTKRFHLNAHVRAKHAEKIRNQICNICSKAFYSLENLKKHIDSHNEKDMPCEYCGKLFSCINNLRTHLYYHSEPKFICEVASCGKKFYMRKRLRAHMKSHANQKDFLCQFCDKSYFSQVRIFCLINSMD